MAELLRPYTDFNATDLAVQPHLAVRDNEQWLALRGMAGALRNYGTKSNLAQVLTLVHKARQDHAEANPIHFAVVDRYGDVQGAAVFYPDAKLPLRRLKWPVPPAYAGRSASGDQRRHTTFPVG